MSNNCQYDTTVNAKDAIEKYRDLEVRSQIVEVVGAPGRNMGFRTMIYDLDTGKTYLAYPAGIEKAETGEVFSHLYFNILRRKTILLEDTIYESGIYHCSSNSLQRQSPH